MLWVKSMFDKILVVCIGNICRSPTGERLLQQLLPNKEISSAGLGVNKSHLADKPADKMAQQVAQEHGLDLSGHKAKQLTSALCAQFDLILVMEHQHIEALTQIAPEARGKTMLFGHWLNQQNIPDPYRQSIEAFEYTFQLIEKSAHLWVCKL